MQQGHERADVVALEGVDVARQELLLGGVDGRRPAGRVEVERGERRPGALQCAVDRRDRRVEELGDLGGLPAQDLAQDEHRALAGRQVLERGDEREAQRLAALSDLRGVRVVVQDAGVGDGLHPRVLGQAGAQCAAGGRGRTHVHRQRAALRALQHVHADVAGDAVEP